MDGTFVHNNNNINYLFYVYTVLVVSDLFFFRTVLLLERFFVWNLLIFFYRPQLKVYSTCLLFDDFVTYKIKIISSNNPPTMTFHSFVRTHLVWKYRVYFLSHWRPNSTIGFGKRLSNENWLLCTINTRNVFTKNHVLQISWTLNMKIRFLQLF